VYLPEGSKEEMEQEKHSFAYK